MGCLFLIVMLFMTRQSTHIFHEPSFLGTNKTGTSQGERLSLTYLEMATGRVRVGSSVREPAPETRQHNPNPTRILSRVKT
jgi:hypothetical protein